MMARLPQGDVAAAEAMRKLGYRHEDEKRRLNDRVKIVDLKLSEAEEASKKDHMTFNQEMVELG